MLTAITVSKLPCWAGEYRLIGGIRRRRGQKNCQFQLYAQIKIIAGNNYPKGFQHFSTVNGVERLMVHRILRECVENCVLSQENVQPLYTPKGRQLFLCSIFTPTAQECNEPLI